MTSDRSIDPEAPFHRLDTLPRSTWLPALTAAVGTPEARLADARAWLDALVAGTLPAEAADFGDRPACAPLRAAAGQLGLAALSRDVPELAGQVVRTLLWHLDRLNDLQPERTRAQAIEHVAGEFAEAWRLEKAAIEPELALLRRLGEGALAQWAEVRGRLARRAGDAVHEAAAHLARLPEIAALLRRLGRRAPGSTPPGTRAVAPQDAPRRAPLVCVETRLAGAPGEITGIRLDSRLEHMLPSEAAWLRHRLLKRLWRARQAEGRLLAHDTEAVVVDWRPDPAGPLRAAEAQPDRAPLERGPIVLCLDTSGSMRGGPEQVAKAVALAALQSAHEARRGLRLVAFGGPDELLERDLAGAGGLAALLDLLEQGFDGGTDIQTPIERAIASIHAAGWIGADLLVVSDGEFGCVRSTLQSLDEARERLGLRVQGVLVGDRETLGMLEVCDEIHWVRDWRTHAGGDPGAIAGPAASPVHSKSLTAMYFPNALSSYAARHRGRDAT